MAVVEFRMDQSVGAAEMQMRLVWEWARPSSIGLRYYTFRRLDGELLVDTEYYEKVTGRGRR